MKLKHTKLGTFAATLIIFGSLAGGANGATLILDDTNGYSVTTVSSFTISQPDFELNASSNVVFSNSIAALGTSTVADFSSNTFAQIGGGSEPGGNGLRGFANNAIAFTIRDNNAQLYDALITFVRSSDSGNTAGTAPNPDNNAGLVIEITAAAVPEPSSALLLGLAGLGLVTRRKRTS